MSQPDANAANPRRGREHEHERERSHSHSHSREYEFDESQNRVVSGVASKLGWVAVGCAQFSLLGLGYVAWGGGEAAYLIPGCAGLFIGYHAWRASRRFRKIVTTRGRDVAHLMDALRGLDRSLKLIALFAFLSSVALAGGVAWIGYQLATTERIEDLGPHETLVRGERHLTLTGWDRDPSSYALLEGKPDTVVLLMANPDVVDKHLAPIRRMTRLRELDLDDTGISDEGLQALRDLPRLERLRLGNTAITDRGFLRHVFPIDSLYEVNLRGTAIGAETLRAWKTARPGRKVIR